MQSSFPRASLPLAGLLLLARLPAAQAVSGIDALHRSGQTFVTWKELSAADVRYRVYRSEEPLRRASDLDQAQLLGEVDDTTSRNPGRSYALGSEVNWVIRAGEAPLADGDGLFVHTVASPAERAYYAVTSVVAGVEERALKAGTNATGPLQEVPAPPEPVLQDQDDQGLVYGHWVCERDTPFLPALSDLPSQGFTFRFEPGSAPPPRGLLVRLHAAGQDYAQGWPHRFELPDDVDILAPNDIHPRAGWTFWFGLRQGFPDESPPDARVRAFTLARVAWTMDWIAAQQGPEHDPERVYAVGSSMGGMGAMYLAGEFPERFAAILCRSANFDLLAGDLRNPEALEHVFGAFELDLSTDSGLGILERTDAAFLASLDPAREWPLIRTLNGRNDPVVGWRSAPRLFAGLAAAHRPAVHYFDLSDHSPFGYWQPLERSLLARTCSTRRDRPALRFEECSLDDDPGDGDPLLGDPVGTINGYVDYDPRTVRTGPDFAEFDVYLRANGRLDDAPAEAGRARLTPRRLGASVAAGDAVRYTLRAGALLLDEELLFPDQHGLVHTPLAPLAQEPRCARFERWSPPARPHLHVDGLPRPGEPLQLVLLGSPGDAWFLELSLGVRRGPASARPDGAPRLRGFLDSSGKTDLTLPLPDGLPAGARLVARARIGSRMTAPVSVDLQPPL